MFKRYNRIQPLAADFKYMVLDKGFETQAGGENV